MTKTMRYADEIAMIHARAAFQKQADHLKSVAMGDAECAAFRLHLHLTTGDDLHLLVANAHTRQYMRNRALYYEAHRTVLELGEMIRDARWKAGIA